MIIIITPAIQVELETLLAEIIESEMAVLNAALQVGYPGSKIDILPEVIAAQASAGEFSPQVKAVVVKAAELIHVEQEMLTGEGFSPELVEAVKGLAVKGL